MPMFFFFFLPKRSTAAK
uniref:Uncharacterized protein n=1 Tax=Anguilla anguilla TaxID=7936 RepID=A0A0E9S3T1_ANGAN